MLLREIFNDNDKVLAENNIKISVFCEEKPDKCPLSKTMAISIILHIVVLTVLILLAKILTYILLAFGINLDLFSRPNLKIRDIEFVFVLPEKYDIKKSFTKASSGAGTYSLAGPSPNNRPYNGDEGSLKSDVQDLTKAKDRVVNKKPQVNTKDVASQTTIPQSKLPKKGSFLPKITEPGAFTANIPEAEMTNELGWGNSGKQGTHSPNAGNASFKGSGQGSGGSGEGDTVGNGTTKGGGYYYGAAGAPRPQTANSYKNENPDVDLRPYITELQRRVLRNWSTPNNDNSKKTVLFLRISKSGNLMILNVKSPSGDTHIDELAINAVKNAQPFSPLPDGYRNQYADVILTFDYNVSARAN
ncbi:MAG: TonB C-terminal domain-containing protein [bacterium]|nr:TonB C-terminal domain-containing protein [bacterium]